MARIRYEHKTVLGDRFHVITSPDLKGFYIAAETREEAFREADRVLSLLGELREHDPDDQPHPQSRSA